ncbi:MAG: HNH endonuclease [Neomegalonema sp.]|nr:HNH endonuclease [Neomegalonema sp.]
MRSVCTWPGCKRIVPGEETRCPPHKAKTEAYQRARQREAVPKRRERSPWQSLYNLTIWRKVLRPNQLAAVPFCERCAAMGKQTLATIVHHRIPHKGGRALFQDPANLASSCTHCHQAAEQAAEKRALRQSNMGGRVNSPDQGGETISHQHRIFARGKNGGGV